MVKKKSNAKLGGARPGAGRPATGRKQNLTIRFPPKLHEQLTDTAEDLGLSVSAYVQQIVEAELG
jgi:predicted HicB family RNase H-like nuclease